MADTDETLLSVGVENRWLRALSVFIIGGGLVGAYLWLVGVDAVQRALTHVSTRRVLSLAIVGVVPLVCWGTALHRIFDRLGIAERLVTSVLLFSATGFLNSITPFGQAGGNPVSALLFKRSLGTDFETGLAAIGSVNTLNRLAALFLGLLGISSLGAQVAFRQTLGLAALFAAGLTGGVLASAIVAWQYRQLLVQRGATALASVLGPADHLPGFTPPSRDEFVRRGLRFVEAIERLLAAPGTIGFAFIACLAGQLAVASTLWVALAALGTDPPFAVVVFVIPIAKLGGVAPTPGGFGTAEALLTALLVATIGVDVASAGLAALLYRASAFWLPSVCGGLAILWYTARGLLSPERDAGSSGGTDSPSAGDGDEVGTDPDVGVAGPVLVLSVVLAGGVWIGMHSWHVLGEPGNLVVHTTRDSAVAVLTFGTVWLALRRATTRWLT